VPAKHIARDRGEALAQGVSGKHVLVVDDNDTNRVILREILERNGVIVSEAADGLSALELLRTAKSGQRKFDLVLTDCRMPGIDGFQVAETIDQEGGQAKMVIMLTSSNLSRAPRNWGWASIW
jgi:two-component system, sensor histidine kinase and response regulator